MHSDREKLVERFNNIVDRVEARCMAVDGPVPPTLQEMREDELADLWRTVQSLRAAISELGGAVDGGRIAEVISEFDGACGWRPCSGCHETNEGAETGLYPYSKAFGCHVGAGCSECGGLGVVWEYWDARTLAAMALEQETAPSRPDAGGEVKDEPVAWQYRYRRKNPDAIWSAWGDYQPALASYRDYEGERRPLYTRPAGERPAVAVEALREAARNIVPDLEWTISPESPGHHPTMPSAVAAFIGAFLGSRKGYHRERIAALASPAPVPAGMEGE